MPLRLARDAFRGSAQLLDQSVVKLVQHFRLHLSRCVAVTFLAWAIATPQLAAAQSGYSVTATLDPFFIHPTTGEDITQGAPLTPISGLLRGADGWLYMVSVNDYFDHPAQPYYDTISVIRINPATGAAKVLYVLEGDNADVQYVLLGRNGRVYFLVRDMAWLKYKAEGTPGTDFEFCIYGCVMLVDTANGARLEQFYRWGSDEDGYYPDTLWGEDTEGALYVQTYDSAACNWAATAIKIPFEGEAGEASYFCDLPEFAPSGNDIWHWSNGRTYWAINNDITQVDPPPTLLLAHIASDYGQVVGLAEGSGYIYGLTCCGGALGGGVIFRTRVTSLAAPDLVVAALSDPPATSAPGQTFTAIEVTRNDAFERAASSITTYYLSRTGEQGDIKLKNRYLPELGSFQESSGTVSLKIPDSTPLGTYWLVACADRTQDVAETDNTNNCRQSATTVSLSRPDLVAKSLSNPPIQARPGQQFTVTDTVANEGQAAAPTSTTLYYLSIDAVKGIGDVLLKGSRLVPTLLPTVPSTGNASVTIPTTIPLTSYYLLACADDGKKIAEANEANNCVAAAERVVVNSPDLVTTSVGNPPVDAWPGKSFTASDTVLNQGNILAGSSSTRYYLSLNTLRDAGDILLSGTRSVPTLDPGETSAAGRKVTVPSGAALGLYNLLACADDTNNLAELNESNNCRASGATIKIAWPDLVTTAVSNPPASAVAGQKFSMSDTVHNQGQATSVSSTTRYYLSLDGARGPGDLLMVGTRDVMSLSPGASAPGSRLVTVPSSTPPGSYFVLACADDLGKTSESNNANNCSASATTVTIIPASP